MIRSSFRPLALTLMLGAPTSAQNAGQGLPQFPMITESQLVMRYFTPKAARAEELASVIAMSFGSQFQVYPDGATNPGGPTSSVRRAIAVGSSIVVRDTAEQIEKVMESLGELDRLAQEDRVRAQAEAARLEIVQYHPRYVSQATAYGLLESYGLTVDAIPGSDGVIFSSTPEVVATGRKALDALDVAPREVTLTCMLVQGLKEAPHAPDPLLPADLSANLRALVPMAGFDVIATGVVRSSVTAVDISLESQIEGGLRYMLQLKPQSYDERTGALTIGNCEFELRVPTPQNGPVMNGVPFQSQEFRTALTLRAGEYTVMGAVGADPVFVVLRLVPAPAR